MAAGVISPDDVHTLVAGYGIRAIRPANRTIDGYGVQKDEETGDKDAAHITLRNHHSNG